MELYEDSPGEHSTGSTLLPHSAGENLEHSLHQDSGTELKSIQIGEQKGVGGCDQVVLSSETLDQADIFPSCEEQINNDGIVPALSSTELNSPLQVTGRNAININRQDPQLSPQMSQVLKMLEGDIRM